MKGRWMVGLVLLMILFAASVLAQGAEKPLTLEESVKIALERDLRLQSAIEQIMASEFRRRAAFAEFLPKWTGQYSYTRLDETPHTESIITGPSGKPVPTRIETGTRDNYTLNTTISQTLFAGGAIDANYHIEVLGLNISKVDSEAVKRDIVLLVREGYFIILATEKLRTIGEQNVKLLEAQLEVTKAFFEVGIVPKNDVLQAEVRLSNARQQLVRADNAVSLAKSSFNNLLRRDVNEALEVVDILEYKPFPLRFEDCLDEALEKRPEIRSLELKVDQAKESVRLAKSGFYPTVGLSGNYSRFGDEPWVDGTRFREPYSWNVGGLITFTLGDWGRVGHRVSESKVKVTQTENSKNQVVESIVLEVKRGYLNVIEAEKNIAVTEKAIEQAEENLRMNEERYKYQVATQTEVLDAVTLLAQARVNYLSALSDFNIARARLDRAMGKMYP